MKIVDLGICLSNNELNVSQETRDCKFDEAGDTFTCTVTVPATVSFILAEQGDQEVVYHEKGVYSVTVDVNSMTHQTVRTADIAG